MASGDAAEVLELAQEVLDQVAFTIEDLAEAGSPFAIEFGRDVGNRALRLNQIADAIGANPLQVQTAPSRAPIDHQPPMPPRALEDPPNRVSPFMRAAVPSQQVESDNNPLGNPPSIQIR